MGSDGMRTSKVTSPIVTGSIDGAGSLKSSVIARFDEEEATRLRVLEDREVDGTAVRDVSLGSLRHA